MQSRKEVRAFRLDGNLLRMLALSAQRRGISENAVVEDVLLRNLKAETLAEAFDRISFGKETFRSIIGMTDANGLEIMGSERGGKAYSLARELSESQGQPLTFSQYLTEILGSQGRWFKVEGALVKPEKVTLYHGMGPKWSSFLKSYLASAYATTSRTGLQLKGDGDFVSVEYSLS